jgi:hypothetical protein
MTKRTIQKHVRLTEQLAQKIDDFRHEHRIGSETEAIRVLIAAGLKAFKIMQAAPATTQLLLPRKETERTSLGSGPKPKQFARKETEGRKE